MCQASRRARGQEAGEGREHSSCSGPLRRRGRPSARKQGSAKVGLFNPIMHAVCLPNTQLLRHKHTYNCQGIIRICGWPSGHAFSSLGREPGPHPCPFSSHAERAQAAALDTVTAFTGAAVAHHNQEIIEVCRLQNSVWSSQGPSMKAKGRWKQGGPWLVASIGSGRWQGSREAEHG